MKKLIAFVVLLSFAFVFAEDYAKGAYYCKIARSCELSSYTGEYTKNCKDYNADILIYWEYGYNKYGDLVFCSNPKGAKELCTRIISVDTDEDNGEKILIIQGETINYILGNNYFIITYHKFAPQLTFFHSLCNYHERS